MGDVFKPKEMPTKRNTADDAFARSFKNFITSSEPGSFPDIGSWISDTFALPAYEGKMSAGMNPAQVAAAGFGQDAVGSFFGPGGGNEAITKALTGIIGDPGSAATPESLFAALDAPRKASLQRDLGQMEEEFGLAGMAGSTALAETGARAATESQANLLAEVSRMAPALEAARHEGTRNRLAASQLLGTIPLSVAQGGFQLGEAERGIEDMDLQRLYGEFMRQQGLFPSLLQYLGGTPQAPYGPSMFDNLLKGGLAGAAFL